MTYAIVLPIEWPIVLPIVLPRCLLEATWKDKEFKAGPCTSLQYELIGWADDLFLVLTSFQLK